MTPQVTRIDAHLLNRPGVTRLCYCGNVLHARPADPLSSRELLQIGAEIYGHGGFEADLEVIHLVLDTVAIAEVRNPRLDLCHPGVLRGILEADPAAAVRSKEIIPLLRDKDVPGLAELAQQEGIRPDTLTALRHLLALYGGREIIEQARQCLPPLSGIVAALEALQVLADALPDVPLSVDLADVGGYGYHSGVTFALYAEGWHNALVSGGRYDDVSRAFGRARPATGFSLDLRKLAAGLQAERARAIRAPWGQDPALIDAVRRLRRAGEIVIQALPGHAPHHDEFVCDRELAQQHGAWTVKQL